MMGSKMKLTLKILSACLLILFFCPTFMVSCSGQDVNVSGLNLLIGFSSEEYGRLTDPQFIMIIFLIIPIAALVVLFKKNADAKKNNLIISILALVEFIGWIIVKHGVENWCKENYCSFTTKAGYVLNMLCALAMLIIGIGLYMGFISEDGINISGVNIPVGKGWNCPKCGARNDENSKFCTGCGEPKPILKYCSFCGGANPKDNKFCVSCGKEFPIMVQPDEIMPVENNTEVVENEEASDSGADNSEE